MAKAHLYHSYITTAAILVTQYDGGIPFNDFLKKYFALHKKYGSRDRKHITHLCYCYYRLGHATEALETEDKILLALFLCSSDEHEILAELKSEWKENFAIPIEEKLKLLGYPFSVENIFPWQDELGEDIDGAGFAKSHFIQPDLFLRVRPGSDEQVKQKLFSRAIAFEEPMGGCIALANNTKIDELLVLNKEVVIQDYSSQRISEFLQVIKSKTSDLRSAITVWDCCAASGGKSILAHDVLGDTDLTVSDVRISIIQNLKKRFAEAGIKKYHSFIKDINNSPLTIHHSPFDLIICDVPCSGSGTWGRTPEQLHFFAVEKIDYYASLQKQIVQNVLKHVKPGGYFLYITCSVFTKENEEVINFILENADLQLMKKEVLIGYDKKADTMFAALFKNSAK